ncbi:MAG: hypothetical protein RI580_00565, partial [Halothece sp. Uz-M2-17]|nr:hypothetical protein [Halothece sp. Uz-M2-17]
MLSNWEAQLIQFLEADQYDELFQWCEQAINNSEQGCLPYWYLGLGYLLRREEDEAQAVWLSGFFEAPGEETSEQRMKQLANILEREAQQQANREAFSISADIREQLQELQPENINNSLQLIKTLVHNQTFSSKLIEQWEFLDRLEVTATQNINEQLLMEVVYLLLVEPLEIDRTSLIDTAYKKIQKHDNFVKLIFTSGMQLSYVSFKKKLALEVMELCQKIEPN